MNLVRTTFCGSDQLPALKSCHAIAVVPTNSHKGHSSWRAGMSFELALALCSSDWLLAGSVVFPMIDTHPKIIYSLLV